jgi:hypothetical protein
MSVEIDVVSEVYTILKQYIPQKDRQEAADNLMSIMVDMLNDVELKEFSGTDAALGRAFKEYAGEFEEDYNDEDYED